MQNLFHFCTWQQLYLSRKSFNPVVLLLTFTPLLCGPLRHQDFCRIKMCLTKTGSYKELSIL